MQAEANDTALAIWNGVAERLDALAAKLGATVPGVSEQIYRAAQVRTLAEGICWLVICLVALVCGGLLCGWAYRLSGKESSDDLVGMFIVSLGILGVATIASGIRGVYILLARDWITLQNCVQLFRDAI